MSLNWVLKKFDELTVQELYAILCLRNEVFVVEQNCIYQDADQKDQHCYHLAGWKDDKLVAYTRLLPPGLSYTEPSIGRVVTSPSARGSGLGRDLMEVSIAKVFYLFGQQPIRISAQVYLTQFYISLGFVPMSEEYDEDGIPHIEMVKS